MTLEGWIKLLKNIGIVVVVENSLMNNFHYWLEFKCGMDCELEFLEDGQIWNWFEFLGAVFFSVTILNRGINTNFLFDGL
jgi:hypothetical protein